MNIEQLHYYTAIITLVGLFEYCVPVWHYVLTKAQTEQLESLQKRAIHIMMLHSTRGMPYMSMLSAANLSTLAIHREDISQKFFLDIIQSNFCLHYILPAEREQSLTSRLRTYEKLPSFYPH